MAKSEEAKKRENIAAYFEGSMSLLFIAGISENIPMGIRRL